MRMAGHSCDRSWLLLDSLNPDRYWDLTDNRVVEAFNAVINYVVSCDKEALSCAQLHTLCRAAHGDEAAGSDLQRLQYQHDARAISPQLLATAEHAAGPTQPTGRSSSQAWTSTTISVVPAARRTQPTGGSASARTHPNTHGLPFCPTCAQRPCATSQSKIAFMAGAGKYQQSRRDVMTQAARPGLNFSMNTQWSREADNVRILVTRVWSPDWITSSNCSTHRQHPARQGGPRDGNWCTSWTVMLPWKE
jgi:hypothetical protein